MGGGGVALKIKECSLKEALPEEARRASSRHMRRCHTSTHPPAAGSPSSFFSASPHYDFHFSFFFFHHQIKKITFLGGEWRSESQLWMLLPRIFDVQEEVEAKDAKEHDEERKRPGMKEKSMPPPPPPPRLSVFLTCTNPMTSPSFYHSHRLFVSQRLVVSPFPGLWKNKDQMLQALRRQFHEVVRKRLGVLRCLVSYGKLVVSLIKPRWMGEEEEEQDMCFDGGNCALPPLCGSPSSSSPLNTAVAPPWKGKGGKKLSASFLPTILFTHFFLLAMTMELKVRRVIQLAPRHHTCLHSSPHRKCRCMRNVKHFFFTRWP